MPTYIDTVLKQIEDQLGVYESGGDLWIEEQGWEENEKPIRQILKSSLEHFAQVVENEVIGEDQPHLCDDAWDENNVFIDGANQLRSEQRTKLKALLHPTQEKNT